MGNTVKYAVALDDKMTAALKTLGIEAKDVDDEIKKLIVDAGGLTKAEADAAVATKRYNAQLEAKAKLLGVTTGEVTSMRAEEKRLTDEHKRAASEMSAASSAMTASLVAGAAAVVAGFTKMLKSVVDMKNKFNDLAVETGFTAQELVALDLAARSGGDSIEALVPSLRQFAKRMQDTADGTGEAKEAFEKLGVQVTNADGTLRSATDVNRQVGEALQLVTNSTEKAALATDLYGRAGGKMLKILSSGSEQLDLYNDKVKALGFSLEEGSEGAAHFQVALADLETKLSGTMSRIVAAMGGEGAFADAIDSFTLGLTFVEQYLSSIGHNFLSLIDLIGSTVGLIPRAIKAALSGEDVSDVFTSYITDFTNSIQNPITNAIAAAAELRSARDALEAGPSKKNEPEGDEPPGEKATKETDEEMAARKGTKTKTTGSGSAAPGSTGDSEADKMAAEFQAGIATIFELRGAFSPEAIQAAVDQFGISLDEIEESFSKAPTSAKMGEINEFLEIFGEVTKEAADTIKENNDQIEKNTEDLAKLNEEQFKQRQENIQAGVGAALGGPQAILSAIGSTGPQGAIIAQVAGLLEAIGSSEEGESPLDQIPLFIDAMTKGLEMLGPILADMLPKLLTESIPALIAALPAAMIAIVDEAIPALLDAIPELISVLITDVIPVLSTYKAQIVKAVVTSVVPALFEALKELVMTLTDRELWAQASKDVRQEFGRLIGQMFLSIGQQMGDVVGSIKKVIISAFSIDFWKSVLRGLIDAVLNFELNTPGLDAFKRTAGIESGGPRGLRGIAERAGDRVSGGGNVIFNGIGFGDDRAVLSRIANARNNRRTGARS